MSGGLGLLIEEHRVPGSVIEWRWRPRGFFGKWQDYVIEVGALDDGHWYVRRLPHPIGGPWRAELYPSKDDAVAVATAVQAEVARALTAAGYRLL